MNETEISILKNAIRALSIESEIYGLCKFSENCPRVALYEQEVQKSEKLLLELIITLAK